MGAYAAFKAVYESVCAMPTPPATALFYERILDQTNSLSQKEFDRHVRKRFFAALDQAPLSIISRIFARLTYYFIAPETSYMIDTISQKGAR